MKIFYRREYLVKFKGNIKVEIVEENMFRQRNSISLEQRENRVLIKK